MSKRIVLLFAGRESDHRGRCRSLRRRQQSELRLQPRADREHRQRDADDHADRRQSVTLGYDASTLVREQGGAVGSVDELEVGERATFFSQNGLLKLVRFVRSAARSS